MAYIEHELVHVVCLATLVSLTTLPHFSDLKKILKKNLEKKNLIFFFFSKSTVSKFRAFFLSIFSGLFFKIFPSQFPETRSPHRFFEYKYGKITKSYT